MDKQVVIITGVCGRIGSRLKKRLENRYEVIGFDRVACEGGLVVDLGSDESVRKAFSKLEGRSIASIVHLAAYYSFEQQYSPLYDAITVQGTRRLLEALDSCKVEQFIFSSTMLVHAPTSPKNPIHEESRVAPGWDYPRSKVATENLIHRMRKGIPSVILRIAGVYDDHCHSIPISHQIQRIYEKKLESYFFPGDIHQGAAFIHMEDLIDAIELCIEKRKALSEELTLVLGEDKTLSYDQLQRKISSLIFGHEMKTWRIPKWVAKMGAIVQGLFFDPFIKSWMIDLADDHYELDISLAKKTIGWAPKRSLEKALPRMISELKSNACAWYKTNQLK